MCIYTITYIYIHIKIYVYISIPERFLGSLSHALAVPSKAVAQRPDEHPHHVVKHCEAIGF